MKKRESDLPEVSCPSLWRIQTVLARTGLSKTMLYLLMSKRKFPRPVQLSLRAVAWSADEVIAWVEAAIRKRGAPNWDSLSTQAH